MPIEFDNFRPIYIQIVEDLKTSIISGKYKCNEQLPAVRNMAIELKVNPNTVQRAYMELEHIGLVYTDRTNGRYVTNDKELIQKLKMNLATEKIEKFLDNMNSLGINTKEIIDYLKSK